MANSCTKINESIRGTRKTTDKNKARKGMHVCAHFKCEVYHKEGNCLQLEANKAKRYPG